MPDPLDIGVLIPTINEPTLRESLAAVTKQFPPDSVYLLGYGESRAIAEEFGCHFIDCSFRTVKSILVNRAVLLIPRQQFIILDADAIPQPGWAEAMTNEFNRGRAIFSGAVDLACEDFWMRVYNVSSLHEFQKEKPSGFRKHLPAISLGFTKEYFLRMGPFSIALARSEDYEWTLRASRLQVPLYFCREAVVLHKPVLKNSLHAILRTWFESAHGNWMVRKLYRDVIPFPWFLRWPAIIFLLAPFLAFLPTIRILLVSPKAFLRNLSTLPFVYLSKLAWCYGVFAKEHNSS